MRYLAQLILLFLVQPSLGADFKEIDIMAAPRPPYIVVADVDQLYHWTSRASIDRLYREDTESQTKFPFDKEIGNGADLAKSFPQLSGRKGFFTWKNSVGGMGASKQEMYADKDEPALVRFQMKKNLKILVLTSTEISKANIDPELLKEADIIFHTRQYNFHEFIIINPDAVLSEVVDPQLLAPDIKRDIQLFNDKSMARDKNNDLDVTGDLYNCYGRLSQDFTNFLQPILSNYMSLRPGSCEAIFR